MDMRVYQTVLHWTGSGVPDTGHSAYQGSLHVKELVPSQSPWVKPKQLVGSTHPFGVLFALQPHKETKPLP